jgi:hypothetical protein
VKWTRPTFWITFDLVVYAAALVAILIAAGIARLIGR